MQKLIPLAAVLSAALTLALCPTTQDKRLSSAGPLTFEGSMITALEVSDLGASRSWYTKILGAEVCYEYAPGGWCELTTPVKSSLIGLSQIEKDKKITTNGGSKLSFGVRDIKQAKDWLLKNEVKFLGDIVEIPQTVKLLSFSDPDGNTLMFYEPLGK